MGAAIVRRKVVVVTPIHPAGQDILDARPDIETVRPASQDSVDIAAALESAEAVVLRATRLTPELLAAAPRLRVISRHGVGLDNVPLSLCAERGVKVAHVGDVNATAVAEHTVALLLAVMRQLLPHDRAVREGRYGVKDQLLTRELAGKTILILGVGRIGSEVARLAAAFRMRVLGFDPKLSADALRSAGCEAVSEWRSTLPDVDVVTLHLPLLPDTRNVLGEAELARMKASAVVVNCSRGGLIDEDALNRRLRDGALFGAGLDVTAVEPPRLDHPLLANDRVVLHPHAAALTLECAMRMATRSAQNVLDHFDGRLDPKYIAV